LVVVFAAIALQLTTQDYPRSPTGLVQAVVTAYEEHNQGRLQDYFCSPALAATVGPSGSATVRFSNLDIGVPQRAGRSAQVEISGTISTTGSGTQAFRWLAEVRQSGNRWCVAEITASSD
jgi:hypothetical protein